MKFKFYFLTVILFLMSTASFAQDVPGNVVQAKGYKLGPGDEVTVKVFGEKDFDFVASVGSQAEACRVDRGTTQNY